MLIPRGAGRDSTRFFERRRKKVVGEGGMAWNFKHGAHNGLGHILVYLVMIPTNEVQLLDAILRCCSEECFHSRGRNCAIADFKKLIIEIGDWMENGRWLETWKRVPRCVRSV